MAQFVVIKSNTYQDSLRLMRLSKVVESDGGARNVSVMMGTPLNKDQLAKADMLTDEIAAAGPNDLVITAQVPDDEAGRELAHTVDAFLSRGSVSSGRRVRTTRSLDGALKAVPDANIGLISIPGEFAAPEARRLLDRGINVFLFSDNVSLEEEISLKEHARDAGLIVMGPDCGTGLIAGAPLGFANAVRAGNIGLVAASGTGSQEVMVHITRFGGGLSHVIGAGGRDLSTEVGGISSRQAMAALAADPGTDVIVLVSKPPAPSVRDEIVALAANLRKPVVTVFVGEGAGPAERDGVWSAGSLFDGALLAVELGGPAPLRPPLLAAAQQHIHGLFTGGTFAAEAAAIVAGGLGLPTTADHSSGYMVRSGGHEIIDLGDDAYTRGKPHPMIEPSVRSPYIASAIADPSTAVVLVDVVLGYGSHDDPAGVLAESVTAALAQAHRGDRQVAVVAAVCGTGADPQDLAAQQQTLQDAGISVLPSNASAARYAVNLVTRAAAPAPATEPDDPLVASLLGVEPAVINMGLREFADALADRKTRAVHFDWRPAAGGDKHLQDLLAALR